MPETSVTVLDPLNSLLDVERRNIFRLTGAGSPYLNAASPELRQRLAEMADESYRHEHELSELIVRLGGRTPDGAREGPDAAYFEFLSLKFLLPKLANEKSVLIRYYENALHALGKSAPEARKLLRAHLDRHTADLELLNRSTGELRAH